MSESVWETLLHPAGAIPAPTPATSGGSMASQILSNEDAAAQELAFGSNGRLPGDPATLIQDALAAAVQAVLPSSGFQYGRDPLPTWFPEPLRALVDDGSVDVRDFQGTYDPYFGTSAAGDEMVYMGEVKRKSRSRGETGPADGMSVDGMSGRDAAASGVYGDDEPRTRDRVIGLQAALNLPYQWDDDEVLENMRRFREAGWQVTNFDQLKDAWSMMVDRAAKTFAASGGQRKVTPWDMLELSRREAEDAGTFTNYESGSQTITYSSVTDVSEGAAWQTLRTTLSALLGRDPSDQEVRDFAYRMNTLAAKNPTITESIQRFEAGEMVAEDRTTTGGFDASDMAQSAYEQAQDDPEYAKVQAGTTYYNTFLNAIGAIGDV